MYAQLSTLALLVPLVTALGLETPSGWTSGGQVTARWINAAGDPGPWSLELVNPTNFHNSFAIANNVDASAGVLNLTLPIVPPGDGYVLEAVNVTDISVVFAQTGSFSIGATVSTTTSSSSTASSSSNSSITSASGNLTSTVSGNFSRTSSGLSATASQTASASGSRALSGSGTATNTGTGASASATTFNGNNNGASSVSSFGVGSWVAMALTAVAGAMVAL